MARVHLWLMWACCCEPLVGGSGPHIVMILVDDLAWGGVGYQSSNPTEVHTPNIDRLATKEGVRMGRAYSHYVCSPSRSSFQSGRLPVHVNIINSSPYLHNPKDQVSGFAGIPRNMTCLATKLKTASYATHQVGKWDAGMATFDHTPQGRGYDSSFNYFNHQVDYWDWSENHMHHPCNHTIKDCWNTSGPCHLDMASMTTPQLLGNPGQISKAEVPSCCDRPTEEFVEMTILSRALSIINAHDPAIPFFLDYNMHVTHDPLEIPLEFWNAFDFIPNDVTGNYHRRIYHGMVAIMDQVVQQLEHALRAKDMWKDTVLVLQGDNGGASFAGNWPPFISNNFPHKGSKGTPFEGGIRVPSFVSGGFLAREAPHRLGSTLMGMVHLADWYAVFCGLAGVPLDDVRACTAGLPPVDALDLWPYIAGAVESSPRAELHVDSVTLLGGKEGRYKLLRGSHAAACNGGPIYPNASDASCSAVMDCGEIGCLFDVLADSGEHDDISQMPTSQLLLEQLNTRLSDLNEDIFMPDRGSEDPRACQQAVDNGGFWGPFVFPHTMEAFV